MFRDSFLYHSTDEEMRDRNLSSLSVTVSVGQDLDVGSVDGALPGDGNIKKPAIGRVIGIFPQP